MQTLLVWLYVTVIGLHSTGGSPVPTDSVRLAAGVRDPVFAYLTGLIDADLYGAIDAEVLKGAVKRTTGSSKLPYTYLVLLTRDAETPGRTAQVEADFDKPLAIQIPYQILGYHPGKLRASQNVRFREWILGDTVFGYNDEKGKPQEVRLTDIHLFAVLQGTLLVDIDGWVDRLAGGKLDDTRITGLVLFRGDDGERYGLAVGYNRGWEGRSGLLSLSTDEIRFPSPTPMKVAAWKLRQILEGLEPSLRPDSLRSHASG